MRSFFVVAAFAFIAVVQAGLTEDQKAQAMEAGKACVAETGASPADVLRMRAGEVIENDKTKCFVKCFLEKNGFFKDGKVQADVAIESLSKGIDKEKVSSVVNECSKAEGADDCEKAFNVYKCANEKGYKDIL